MYSRWSWRIKHTHTQTRARARACAKDVWFFYSDACAGGGERCTALPCCFVHKLTHFCGHTRVCVRLPRLVSCAAEFVILPGRINLESSRSENLMQSPVARPVSQGRSRAVRIACAVAVRVHHIRFEATQTKSQQTRANGRRWEVGGESRYLRCA